MDGVAWRVEIDERDFAIKVFWNNDAPEGTALWAVQRECHSAALLQMIQTALRMSDEPIHLHPEPRTYDDGIGNLYAFSDKGRQTRESRNIPGAAQYTSTPRLRECYGWTEIRGQEPHSLPRHLRPPSVVIDKVPREIRPTENYYVSQLIKEQRPLDVVVVQSQLDFYWREGFCLASYLKPDNWKHPGVLMDMTDLICPWHAGWFKSNYVRRAAQEVVGGDDRGE
ncbi:hypothetical protein BR93DRAFT_958149 [Coniochaeta sp. PMI_546]|nr:hypothetical protein BR93DRAFT_958149 [Coniochaeta sp. PMI_546]